MDNFLKGSVVSSSLFIVQKSHFFLMDRASSFNSNQTIPFLGEKVFRWLPYVGGLLLIFIVYFLYQQNKKRNNGHKKNSKNKK